MDVGRLGVHGPREAGLGNVERSRVMLQWLLRLNGIGWPGLVAWVGVRSTRWSMAQGLARRQGTGRSEGGQRARCSGMVVQRK
jgi:hypothetical protein